MADKPAPHLRDLFLKGQEYEFKSPPATGLRVWVQRPSSIQQDLAARAARTKRTRRRAELLNKDSDERRALEMELADLDLDGMLNELLGLKSAEFQRQALNEVLYSEEYGSDWGKEGEKYMDLLDALIQRSDELTAQAGDGTPDFENDEEWKRLTGLQDQFQREVSERQVEIVDEARAEFAADKTLDEIRDLYIKRHVEADADGVWYMEYKHHMLYYSVRDLEEHSKLYFDSPAEVSDMPIEIQRELLDITEALSMEAEQLKNLLTPQPS